MIRIGVIGPSLNILGGQAVQLQRLMSQLRCYNDIELELVPVNPALSGWFGRLQRYKYIRTLVTESAYLKALATKLSTFDVIHIFSASYFSFLLGPAPALILGKRLGKPVILNYHSGEAADHLKRWRRTAGPIIRQADSIVVPSEYLVNVFHAAGLHADAIANAIEPAEHPFRIRSHPRPIFLSNRNFEEHYGVADVLRAFRLIQDALPSAELVLAGDGSQRGKLLELVDTLKLDHVTYVGAVTPQKMVALYDRADIYLNASYVDNMPLSILEAFASGMPVVSSAAGGIPYMVRDGDNGILVDTGDHEALALAALRLIDDRELALRLATAAFEDVRARYSWAAVRHQWYELYSELAGDRALAREQDLGQFA